MMIKRLVVLLIPLVLTSCAKLEELGLAKSSKVKLTGKRETVLLAHIDESNAKPETNVPVVVPQAQDIKDWPQAGYCATHLTPHAKASEELRPIWNKSLKVKITQRQRLLCEPIVADGKLFIYTPDSYLSAYEAKSGNMLWTIFLKPEKVQDAILGGGAAYDQGTLYVSTPFAELFAIDVESGKPKWSVKTTAPLRNAPTISEGRVYAVTINNEIYAIDQMNGEVLWTHTGIMEYAGLLGGCTPSISKDVVIVPYSSGEVYALRTENGHPLWTDSLASPNHTDSVAGMPHIHAKPVIDEGRVYIVSNSGRTAAFDIRTGEIIWHKNFGGTQTPLVAGDFIYLVDANNDLICMTKNDGLVRWVESLPLWGNKTKQKDRVVWHGPIMAGSKLLLAGSNGRVMAINPMDGSWSYEFNIPGKAVAPPIAADGIVYVVSDKGALIAFQ